MIRRTALEGIGGVPHSTVTEDCHASLRMQKAGWRTAYLRIPLAAGLATERLMLHIGQRLRGQGFDFAHFLIGPRVVIPAKAGIHSAVASASRLAALRAKIKMDSGFRRNDGRSPPPGVFGRVRSERTACGIERVLR